MRRTTLLAVVVVVVAAVAAAGFLLTMPREQTATLRMSEYVFLLDGTPNPTVRVKAGTPVKLTVTNVGGLLHELMIVDKATYDKLVALGKVGEDEMMKAFGGQHPPVLWGVMLDEVKPGETRSITFTPDKAGTYYIVCLEDVPDEVIHLHKGMTAVLVVEP